MNLQTALDKITAQQPKERTPVWMVGEQLKDMLRAEPGLAEIVAQDLEVKEMNGSGRGRHGAGTGSRFCLAPRRTGGRHEKEA